MTTDREATLKVIVATVLGVTPAEVSMGQTLLDGPHGADSLDVIEIVMAAEEEFCAEITDEEAEKCATVGDLLRVIESKVSA